MCLLNSVTVTLTTAADLDEHGSVMSLLMTFVTYSITFWAFVVLSFSLLSTLSTLIDSYM